MFDTEFIDVTPRELRIENLCVIFVVGFMRMQSTGPYDVGLLVQPSNGKKEMTETFIIGKTGGV